MLGALTTLVACSGGDGTAGPSSTGPGGAVESRGAVVGRPAGGLPTLQEPPAGFALQDYLDLRIAVGADWYVLGSGDSACPDWVGVDVPATDSAGRPGTLPVVTLYEGPPLPCKHLRQFRVHDADDEPWNDAHTGAFGIDHALRAEVRGEECDDCAVQIRLVDLHMQVDVERLDAGARQLLDLLSASPVHQALSDGPMADTSDWKSVDAGTGMTALVPPAWLPAHDLRTDPAAKPACDRYPFAAGSTVFIGVPGMPIGGTAPEPTYACDPHDPAEAVQRTWGPPIHPAADGLWLEQLMFRKVPTAERTLAGRTIGLQYPPWRADGGLVAYGASAAPPTDRIRSVYTMVVVNLDGHWAEVGLGSDPTIARTVLANLRTT